jgi:hypothetical protein
LAYAQNTIDVCALMLFLASFLFPLYLCKSFGETLIAFQCHHSHCETPMHAYNNFGQTYLSLVFHLANTPQLDAMQSMHPDLSLILCLISLFQTIMTKKTGPFILLPTKHNFTTGHGASTV